MVPNLDLKESLNALNEAMEGGAESYAKIIHSFRFAPHLVEESKVIEEEGEEEEESSFYMTTPSSKEEDLGEISSSSTVVVNLDQTRTEKALTTIEEGSVITDITDAESMWQPTLGRGMASFTSKVEAKEDDAEDAAESIIARKLFEVYGGEFRRRGSSLIRKAQELVEKKIPFDAVELSSLKR